MRVKTKYGMPFCVCCLWRVGMSEPEIQHRVGYFANPHINARAKWGVEFVPKRKAGGDNLSKKKASIPLVTLRAGIKYELRKDPDWEYWRDLYAEIERAYWNMPRRPFCEAKMEYLDKVLPKWNRLTA